MIQVFFFQAKNKNFVLRSSKPEYFCIESISKNIWWHMRTTNLGMMYIFVSQALFLRPIDRFESVHTCCENDNILQSCRDVWILICLANTFMQHTYTHTVYTTHVLMQHHSLYSLRRLRQL